MEYFKFFIGLRAEIFIVAHAALKAVLSKVFKHEKTCFDNQHAFISFVFDTFNFIAPKIVSLLYRV
jgi:hypothetical protein